MKRLYVDVKEDCHGEVRGNIKFPADSLFVFEALLLVIDQFSASCGVPPHEIISDLYNFRRKQS